MWEPAQVSYDDVAYEGHTLSRVHPDSFSVMGRLFGLDAPPAEGCRVLELGCGSGANIASVAYTLPGATCVGLDSSEKAIERGRKRASAVVLPNLALEARNILGIDDGLGRFDYVICHGVFSWVPCEVQDKILEIAGRHLTDNGVAYISFNAYPGWHMRRMAREIMLYHAASYADPARRAEQARAVLDLITRFTTNRDKAYKAALEEESRHIQGVQDWYLVHDNLAAINTPLYFHEFMERAEAAGLQYLGPAQFIPWESNLSEELKETLDKLPDRIRREQYIDFLAGRTFRRPLLCRAGLPVHAEPSPSPMPSFWITANARPMSASPDVTSDAIETFETPFAGELSTGRPLLKTMLTQLAQVWPKPVGFQDLWTEISERLAPASAGTADEVAGLLLKCFQAGFVDLHSRLPVFAVAPGERPVASALARLEARDQTIVTNLKHHLVSVDVLPRLLLQACDGTRDRGALLELVLAEAGSGELQLHDADGQRLTDPEKIREASAANLEPGLTKLANHALLTG
jgi:methyltransferase-like protein/ubiquinone/menaquinone biosynthesis C-methylase UbiE